MRACVRDTRKAIPDLVLVLSLSTALTHSYVVCRYATFAALAGVNKTDTRAALADLPPVDGLDLWPYLTGQVKKSPRTEVPPCA